MGSIRIRDSLRHLCVLCVSAVSVSKRNIHRRDAENAETAQRKLKSGHYQQRHNA